MPPAAIILATRPAPWTDSPIALLPWIDEDTLIEYVIAGLRHAGVRDIEVVLGFHADAVIPLISGDNVEPIVDARWSTGLASSIRAGASAVVRGTNTAIIADVAAPRPASFYQRLLDVHLSEGRAATGPSGARHDTPVVVNDIILAELRNLRDDVSIESALARHGASVSHVPMGERWRDIFIDDQAAYERALTLSRSEG